MRSPAVELVPPPPPPFQPEQAVWKYPLAPGTNTVVMPANAQVLHVAEQGGKPTLWAQVQTTFQPKVFRRFVVIGTGWPLPGDPRRLRYVGTAHCGPLVWHVYEEEPGDARD